MVDVRRGALAELGAILSDQRISTSGRVAIAVGSTYGPIVQATFRDGLAGADWFTVDGGTINTAIKLVEQIRLQRYDAIVGIGGGTVLDVTKFAAARLGLPMVAVATNLAHDGIALADQHAGQRRRPRLVRRTGADRRPRRPRPDRPGTGALGPVRDRRDRLQPVRDRRLGDRPRLRGEEIDGLAVSLARTAAQAVMNHPGTIADDTFLATLAEGLVLSGISMVVAGTSRPSSGACHEISHAIDLLHPAAARVPR